MIQSFRVICLGIVLILVALAPRADTAAAAPVVWTGPEITFTKSGIADPTLAANQDRMTDDVWLTRGSMEGMFNIAPGHETAYVRFSSPDDTLWATDAMAANSGKTITASNWENLSFTTWAAAYGGPGAPLIGNITTRGAVVHLLSDDVYLNLRFSHFASGGDFTYQRSTVPEPNGLACGLVALGALSLRRRRVRW
jgi:hypothetical protein